VLRLPAFLTPLEATLLAALINGGEFFKEELASQLSSSQLKSREFNGYGFFINFLIQDDVPRLPWQDYRLHAQAKIGGELCGFMLWIKSGRVDFLEGYPLGGDAWPESQEVSELKLN